MQEDEFIAAVQRRTQVESRETAYAVTNATLTVLRQRITGEEAENIASQLPERLGNQLTSEKGQAEEFSVEEFVERVSERFQETGEGTASTSNVEHHVRGVLSVLGNAVSGSELDDARNQLPSEFESLFEPIDMSEQQT